MVSLSARQSPPFSEEVSHGPRPSLQMCLVTAQVPNHRHCPEVGFIPLGRSLHGPLISLPVWVLQSLLEVCARGAAHQGEDSRSPEKGPLETPHRFAEPTLGRYS